MNIQDSAWNCSTPLYIYSLSEIYCERIIDIKNIQFFAMDLLFYHLHSISLPDSSNSNKLELPNRNNRDEIVQVSV